MPVEWLRHAVARRIHEARNSFRAGCARVADSGGQGLGMATGASHTASESCRVLPNPQWLTGKMMTWMKLLLSASTRAAFSVRQERRCLERTSPNVFVQVATEDEDYCRMARGLRLYPEGRYSRPGQARRYHSRSPVTCFATCYK